MIRHRLSDVALQIPRPCEKPTLPRPKRTVRFRCPSHGGKKRNS